MISRYKSLENLGEGGMGVVDRPRTRNSSTPIARQVPRRFYLLAPTPPLSHPSVCHVYEIDEADGRTFSSMASIQGETMNDRISLLTPADQGRIGLRAARRREARYPGRRPPVKGTKMDLGLVRLTEASRPTKADTTMGTVAYMSPEQTRSGEICDRLREPCLNKASRSH